MLINIRGIIASTAMLWLIQGKGLGFQRCKQMKNGSNLLSWSSGIRTQSVHRFWFKPGAEGSGQRERERESGVRSTDSMDCVNAVELSCPYPAPTVDL